MLLFIYRTGPLIGTWCMRMEGKNAYFKRAAQSSNYKNVAYSVAKRHQRLLCGHLRSEIFFDRVLESGPGMLTLQVVPLSLSLLSLYLLSD